jgi:aromatic-L-amino-acid/L-tryptophan decarboxylase
MSSDPLDLEAFRANAHRLVDWMADYLETIEERPVWSDVDPGEVRASLSAHPPAEAEDFEQILRDLDEKILPGITHWQHPGWFAYFPGNSSPSAILGEMAAAALGAQGMLWQTGPAVTEVENLVMDWLVDLMGLPATWRVDTGPGGGVIQTTASDATHTALVAARHRAKVGGMSADRCVAYLSTQAHSSVEKGANVAGYGHVRLVDVDDDHAMSPDLLLTTIGRDLDHGYVPTFVASALGTTGTGAVDPIREIGEIARQYGMWHHVDAAWAGAYMLLPEMRSYQDGLDLVDSYVMNPHKLLFAGVDCTAFWVADRAPLIDAMSILPPYLRNPASESGEVVDYRDWHVALGRRFRALKLMFVIQSFGAEGLREHLRLAYNLADRVTADPRLELVAPAPFGLVCLRHVHGDDATRRLIARLGTAPDVAVTGSELDGRPYLRLSVGQTYTQERHVERLWQLVDTHAAGVD